MLFIEQKFNDNPLFIAESNNAKKEKPWVLYAPVLRGAPPGDHLSPTFKRLLNHGITIVGLDIGENCGGHDGIKLLHELSENLHRKYGFSQQAVLFGGSRGALDLYNFAILNPSKVSAIAAVYPVTNLFNYPGATIAKRLLNIKGSDKRLLLEFNPIQNIYKLASSQIPLFHIHGDQDKTVSIVKNSVLMKRSYEYYGGAMDLQVISGLGHEKSSRFFESPKLINFLVRHSLGSTYNSK